MKKFIPSILVILFSFECLALKVSGTVTERSGAPVSGAKVSFVDSKTPSKEYVAYTNSFGQYDINETHPANHLSLYCYPNPFNRQTVISFHLDQKQRIELAVHNIAGQKVRVIFSGELDSGHHQFIWDGLSQRGAPVAAGTYICSLQTGKRRPTSAKMVVQGGENMAFPVWPPPMDPSEEELPSGTPKIYNIFISGNGFETHRVNGIDLTGVTHKDFVIDRKVWTPFSTTGNYLGVYNGVDYTPVFIKGVNIGATVPGSWPGQLAISSEQYARWFRMIADAGFNTLRIYTLHFPRFYDEFARYNRENPDKPLYLLHGAWLNEEYHIPNSEDDLYSLTEIFDLGIQEVIDCLHGNRTIRYNPRHDKTNTAYGQFRTDVSPWVIGYIIGREIHTLEVEYTNFLHAQMTSYAGAHVSIENASPTEVWLTERIDRLIAHETSNYHTTRPVANSNWPTLDPIDHPSEPEGTHEDDVSINLNKLRLINATGGFFVSYHAYPYYPDFINSDIEYQNAYDDEGLNNYVAYLSHLRSHYTNFPLLITEFGVPSSYGNAFTSISGMNHGGMTEEQQGNFNMRMLRNIYGTDCGGGVMFSWMDEWFKATWITHPLTSGRRNLWHNMCSPENNFGLIRFAPNPNYYNDRKSQDIEMAKVSRTDTWHDFATFNLDIALRSRLNTGDTLWIAFDTYKRDVGESTLPNGKRVINNRAEFLLRITPDSANLYVTKAYNLFGLSLRLCEAEAYQTTVTDGAPWRLLQWRSGTQWYYGFPYIQDIGKLAVCKGNATPKTHQAVHIKDDNISIRLPWTLLNFSDPSWYEVIDDNTSQTLCNTRRACGMQFLKSSPTTGVALTLIYNDEIAELATYHWRDWDLNSEDILDPSMYIEVEKDALSIIREGLKNTPFTPR